MQHCQNGSDAKCNTPKRWHVKMAGCQNGSCQNGRGLYHPIEGAYLREQDSEEFTAIYP